ncbi:MAG: hypothetical protein HOK06_08910 [Rhodospirillaceae bacterium]|jgi:hypothetical protein|nr:hypothetical protein [Rhodospirillaceae bacterium]MBT4218933.1 hypothetical protein [Rhodospirillaceae bacterium]MBT5013144.1 hypothetical protein [Rhodospirillaceae bacterium]MBT5307923.1 hypothetical protein [Rhodospirillaceae bacterium]MBT6407711.1 hypothetical protein [Rhodospirillaceae bacterium]
MEDPVSHAIEVLNEALERDPEAITLLVNMRVECNDRLAAHPTVRTAGIDDTHLIGIMGLLNGALGDSPTGVIGAVGGRNPETGKFTRIKRFIDLREDNLDVLA